MTMDDDSSIYVGGLPYDATEDTIRTVFNLYGAILDVKIINDQRTRGKCYCFVTFTNPRSAMDAIHDMNGRTVDGRVVKVNGVRTRAGRSNFGRERYYYHNDERNGDWDRGRDRDRDRYYDHDNDKDEYRNRDGDWSQERDRSRDRDRDRDRKFDQMHDYDQGREPMLDNDWSRGDDRAENQQENSRAHGGDVDRDHNLDLDTDRKMDRTSDPDRSFDEDRKEHSRRNIDLNVANQHSMDPSSESDGDHNDQVDDQLERSTQQLDLLKKEVSQIEERLEEKRLLVMELQKQSRKLEDSLINVKKHTSNRQMQLTKLHKCFAQVKDCMESLKTSERELQALVDTAMLDSDGDGVGLKDGQLTNGSLDGR
ncbi:glycine-rich RNA-binding protein RZ1B [Gastrolobium bilobum]|uniref:glycine-rich RNA-binding protein RZ1B n=1 Tax=Gastrolobium bilobum TaxID=150636 RepID=UPI002AAF607C|nr:glycine-rich RNA-binding protein RZ1B [Gastrolobium bilobum]